MKIDVIMYSLMTVVIAITAVSAYSMYIKQIHIGYALGVIGLVLFLIGFVIANLLEKESSVSGATKLNKKSVN